MSTNEKVKRRKREKEREYKYGNRRKAGEGRGSLSSLVVERATNSGDFFPLFAPNRMWRQSIENARTIASYVEDRITTAMSTTAGTAALLRSFIQLMTASSEQTANRHTGKTATSLPHQATPSNFRRAIQCRNQI